MKRFRFRLESVLRLRKTKEGECLRDLAQAQRIYQEKLSEKAALVERVAAARTRLETVSLMLHVLPDSQYVQTSPQRLLTADMAIFRARKGIEKALRIYLQAKRQLRIIESLREKDFKAYQLAQKKKEQKDMDDLNVMRHRLKESLMAISLAVGLFVNPAQANDPAKDPSKATDHEAKTAELNSGLPTAGQPDAGLADTSLGVKLVAPKAKDADTCIADASAIEDIQARRQELEVRAKELESREAELNARAKALEEELKKLESVREEIAKQETLGTQQNEEKLAKVVETLENMSPKNAAKLLTALDETLAVSAMQRIDTKKLAKVMNNLEPEVSSRLSESLTGVARVKRRFSTSKGVAAAAQTKGGNSNEQQSSDRNDSSSNGGSSGTGSGTNSQGG